MKQDKEIPKGYKVSPLGIIPKEWEVKRLDEIATITSGATPLRSNHSYFENGDIFWVKTTDLNNGVLTTTTEMITTKALNETSVKILPRGTILIAMYGGFNQIGRTALLSMDAAINQALSALLLDTNKIDNFYILNWLNAKVYMWKNFAASSRKDPNITSKDVCAFPIILPPLPEQQKIAEILTTWDKAIEKQTTLIEKLELRKRGLMQQLLTGKKRLKGNSESWKNYQIKDIANEVSLRNKANKDIVVLSCTKYDGLVPSLDYFGRKVFADDVSTYKIVPKDHFAYATNHIEEGSIGYQSSFHEALISPMYTVFQTAEFVNDSFLFALLKTRKYILEYKKKMEGSIDRRGGLRWDKFSKIKIMLPSISEQTAIANILTTADKELNLARTKLTTLRSQKSGLMQQLLTGKKRINYINS